MRQKRELTCLATKGEKKSGCQFLGNAAADNRQQYKNF